jgi:hypothetical protein
MNDLDEETALAIIFSNTKRKKRDLDILTIAKAFEYLVKLYGSRKAVGEKVGLSAEMVREFLNVLKLPKEVQELVSKRVIDSIDTIKEISAIKDFSKQIEASQAFASLTSKDVRDIKRLIKVEDLSVNDAENVIADAKPKGFHVFVMDFDDEIYKTLTEQACILDIKPAELVREIVISWLKQRTNTSEQ